MQTKAFRIEFTTPYHVGWRRAEPLIDSLTLHRSLIALHNLVYGHSRVEVLINELRTSAVLPIIKKRNFYEPVLPLPSLPSRIRPKKAGLEWVTLSTAISLARNLAKHHRLLITSIKNNKVFVKLDSVTRELCVESKILKSCDEDVEIPQTGFIEKYEVVLNRVDRLTNSADLFKISGYRARSGMMVIFQSNNAEALKIAEGLLKLLGDVGLGGLRSRGLGKFMVEEETRINTEYFGAGACAGYNLLLGSYVLEDPPVDLTSSFVNTKLVAGYSGPPQDEYMLPYLSYAGVGSIIRTRTTPNPVIRSLKTSSIGSLLVFNPVIVGCYA